MATEYGNLELALAVIVSLTAGYIAWSIGRSRSPLPPGPKGLPFIGSVFEPTRTQWTTFARWRTRYGDLAYANVLGTGIMVLNSPSIAKALFHDRRAIYSNRVYKRFLIDIVGYGKSPIMCNADHPYFKPSHRLMHSAVGSRAALDGFVPLLHHEARRFVLRVVDDPGNVNHLLRKFAGTVILRIVYGYDVKPAADEYIDLIEEVNRDAMQTFSEHLMVDLIPALAYLPRWFPGTGWMDRGDSMRKKLNDVLLGPIAFVKQQVDAGTARSSFVASELTRPDWEEQDKELLGWTAQSMYSAGADTTVASAYSFFLCMTLFPDVQARAQSEIDTVIGMDVLPTWGDHERLPYVRALCKELLRWAPAVPQGIPHCPNADGMFSGYFIPKDTIIIANIWGFTRDTDIYPDPEQFDPSRFLGDRPQHDPRDFVFGFGRRVCVGRQLAETSLFVLVSNILATMQISTKSGKDGTPIIPKIEFSSTVIAHPAPFECDIRPRSSKAETLIRTAHDIPYNG